MTFNPLISDLKMCLGHTAKDEFNIIELVTGEGNSSAKAVPIATLHAKSMPTVRNIRFRVTFLHKRSLAKIHTMPLKVVFC